MWKEWRGYFIKASRESNTALGRERLPARSFLAPKRMPLLSLSLSPARGYYCILVSSSSSASDSLRNRSSRSALAKNNKQFVYARPSLSSPFLSSSPVHEGCGSIRYPNRGLNRRLCGSPARFGSQTIPRETPFDVKRKGRVRETLGCLFSSSFPSFLSPSCFSDSRVYGESEDSMFGGDVV